MPAKIKRVYEEPDPADGFRILVDRLWPRGLTKARAKVDLWLRDIAPSTELRKWFDHDPLKWEEFQRRYHEELQRNSESVEMLLHEARKGPVTLLYAAKDELRNEAVILQRLLKK
jgi:uncharacterized protein YeaO (DUF488 family)